MGEGGTTPFWRPNCLFPDEQYIRKVHMLTKTYDIVKWGKYLDVIYLWSYIFGHIYLWSYICHIFMVIPGFHVIIFCVYSLKQKKFHFFISLHFYSKMLSNSNMSFNSELFWRQFFLGKKGISVTYPLHVSGKTNPILI